MKKKVNILGTEYEVVLDAPDEMMPPDSDGAMDHSIKRIVVAKFIPDEIIHAFLYESGLWNNSGNVTAWGISEEITDWFAIQSPKIMKAFEEMEAL